MAHGKPELTIAVALVVLAAAACGNVSSIPAVESNHRGPSGAIVEAPSAAIAPRQSAPVTRDVARNIVNNCLTCHGSDGRSPGVIPNLARLSAAQVAGQLKDFRTGARPSTIMYRYVQAYTDAEIEAVASYIADLNR
jgi:sulfide dehydrogenase cytochrome subunit